MKAKHIYHYLLSHTDEELIRWYNDVMVDPYGDFSDQTIRENTDHALRDIMSNYGLESLAAIYNNSKTSVNSRDKYLMLTGADHPYLITFSDFEGFLKKDGGDLCQFLEGSEELLDELEKRS